MSTVAVVVRMRATMVRRAARQTAGPAAAAVVLLAGAGWLIWYAAGSRAQPATLSILAGVWVLAWIVLPLLLGGVRGRIRPAHLRLETIPPPRMSAALLVPSAVGVGPAVSAVALAALPVHAARDGLRPLLVAALGAALMWLTGLVGSAVALEAAGTSGGPAGAVLTGLFTGSVLGVLNSLWVVAPWAGRLLSDGPPARVAGAAGWLTNVWLLLAVVAALVAAHMLLVRRALAGSARSGRRSRTARGSPATSPVRAVLARELLTWARHPLRLQYLAFALTYGMWLGALPLLAGVDVFAVWAGPLVVLWAGAMSANLIGLDGTSLWTVLAVPGGERAEVFGRQLAWLVVVAPAGVLLTVAAVVVRPGIFAPAALAALLPVLAAGAGASVWASVIRVRPVDDPRRPTAADNPTDIVNVLIVIAAGVLAAAPAVTAVVLGPPSARWWAPLVGLLGGAAVWWGTTALALDRMDRLGPAVLSATSARTRAATTFELPGDVPTIAAMLLLTLGWIPLVAQGLVPLLFQPGGWIVASHLDGTARTATAVAMMVLGAGMLLGGLHLWVRRPR